MPRRTRLVARPLTRHAFAPFGDVIQIADEGESYPINNGTTIRFHDLAEVTFSGPNARPVISMARAAPFSLPLTVSMLERHPDGSQAFVPVRPGRFIIIVATDSNGRPEDPCAFLAGPGQGINYHQNIWHGVLSCIDKENDFLIVDRDGDGPNLETCDLDPPLEVHL